LWSKHWSRIARKLGESDDVILGLDTNILYDCVISRQLLDGFIHTNAGMHGTTPNWLLLIVSSAVMHEIEQAANSRDATGRLDEAGRRGYRGLQEILELDQTSDFPGLSLLVVGEANPVLDTRVELRLLREQASGTKPTRRLRRLSAGDTIIRDQFKTFLRQISFHKSTFFLTADKSNAALAQAEGLHAIYYPKVSWQELARTASPLEPTTLPGPAAEPAQVSVLLGDLIYELAVAFGAVTLSWPTGRVHVHCDLVGESLDHWLNRDLRMGSRDIATLVSQCDPSATARAAAALRLWEQQGSNAFAPA